MIRGKTRPTLHDMHIRVFLFALYRDLVGRGEVQVELPPGATARALVGALRARGGGFARLPEMPVIAVNESYAAADTVLYDGDEVALLPPVAGG